MSKSPKKLKAKRFFRLPYYIFIFFLTALAFLFLPTFKNNFLQTKSISEEKEHLLKNQPEEILFDVKPASYPVRKEKAADPFFSAKAVVVFDIPSSTVLYAKNEDLQLFPASTTKLMTALVTLDQFPIDSLFAVSEPLKIGRIMDLVSGEKITVENLLYGLLIHSANDAAYALAENYPGGLESFVLAMNNKAQELGLENTHFVNPAGFDDDKQYSTAKDLTRLSLVALKNPIIAKIVALPAITVSDTEYRHFHPLTTVNKLLGVVPGVAGVKTGWTENAKENLINLTKRDNKEILTIVLGSDNRFFETQILTNWAFESFIWQDFSYQAKTDQQP